MIIGINGKIGSGKDSVGRIIQYLTAEDSSLECIKKIKEGLDIKGYHNSNWEIKKFATKVKEIATLLTGIPIEKFEDQEFKKTFLDAHWNKEIFENKTSLDKNNKAYNKSIVKPMTVREMLQIIGTDALRNNLHPDTWVNALMCYYIPYSVKGSDYEEYPNWIITDMRFPNEMQAVKANGGITIRVVRPSDKKVSSDLHPSETALDDAEFDYEIINDGTIEDLKEKVEGIILHINLNK